MFFVRPTIEKIYSHSTNPISTYAMYKHYHATNQDLQEYVKKHSHYPTQKNFTHIFMKNINKLQKVHKKN